MTLWKLCFADEQARHGHALHANHVDWTPIVTDYGFTKVECELFIPRDNQPNTDRKHLRCHCGDIYSAHARVKAARRNKSGEDVLSMIVPWQLCDYMRGFTDTYDLSQVQWTQEAAFKTSATDSYGKINFKDGDKKPAKYIRIGIEDNVNDVLDFITDVWNILEPRKPELVIYVTGGAKNFKMSAKSTTRLHNAIISVANSTSAWLITSGFCVGLMKLVGEAVRDGQTFSFDAKTGRATHNLKCIGIGPWGNVLNSDTLVGTRTERASGDYIFRPTYRKAKVSPEPYHPLPLDSNVTHFLLVDNGYRNRYSGPGSVTSFVTSFLDLLKNHQENPMNLVTLMVNGGKSVFDDIEVSIHRNIPVVICEGTERAADVFADAYWHSDENGELSQEYKKRLEEKVNKIESDWYGADKQKSIDVVIKCCRMKHLITIFDIRRDEDLDECLLQAVIKGKQHSWDRYYHFNLAFACNKAEFAETELLKPTIGFRKEFLMKKLTEAIIGDKCNFVRLLLKQDVDLMTYLTRKRLIALYNDTLAVDSKSEHLRRMLHRCTNHKKKHYTLGDIGKLLDKLIYRYDKGVYCDKTESRDGTDGGRRKKLISEAKLKKVRMAILGKVPPVSSSEAQGGIGSIVSQPDNMRGLDETEPAEGGMRSMSIPPRLLAQLMDNKPFYRSLMEGAAGTQRNDTDATQPDEAKAKLPAETEDVKSIDSDIRDKTERASGGEIVDNSYAASKDRRMDGRRDSGPVDQVGSIDETESRDKNGECDGDVVRAESTGSDKEVKEKKLGGSGDALGGSADAVGGVFVPDSTVLSIDDDVKLASDDAIGTSKEVDSKSDIRDRKKNDVLEPDVLIVNGASKGNRNVEGDRLDVKGLSAAHPLTPPVNRSKDAKNDAIDVLVTYDKDNHTTSAVASRKITEPTRGQKDKPSGRDDESKGRLKADRELFIWAVLNNRPELAKYFWEYSVQPISTALMGAWLCKKILVQCESADPELLISYTDTKNYFEKVAKESLDAMAEKYPENAQEILDHRVSRWNNLTCMQIASVADCRDFVSCRTSQTFLKNKWRGSILSRTWKVFLCSLLFPLFMLLTYERDRQTPSSFYRSRCSSVKVFFYRFRSFYTSPMVKYILYTLTYIMFLIFFTYMVLFRVDRERNNIQCAAFIWVFSYICDELHRFIVFPIPSFRWKTFDNEGYTMLIYMLNSLFMVVGFFIHSFSDNYNAVKVIYCINLIIYYIRLLKAYTPSEYLGPKLYIIVEAFKQLLLFFMILFVFLIAYGVASYATLYPHLDHTWEQFGKAIKHIIFVPYWHVYGELMLDEFATDEACYKAHNISATNISAHHGLHCRTSSIFLPIMLAIYLFIGNVLLLNLIIAIFSRIFTDIEDNSTQVWRFQMYYYITEYEVKSYLPPPLNLIEYVVKFLYHIYEHLCPAPKIDTAKRHEVLRWLEEETNRRYLRKQRELEANNQDGSLRAISERLSDIMIALRDVEKILVEKGGISREELECTLNEFGAPLDESFTDTDSTDLSRQGSRHHRRRFHSGILASRQTSRPSTRVGSRRPSRRSSVALTDSDTDDVMEKTRNVLKGWYHKIRHKRKQKHLINAGDGTESSDSHGEQIPLGEMNQSDMIYDSDANIESTGDEL